MSSVYLNEKSILKVGTNYSKMSTCDANVQHVNKLVQLKYLDSLIKEKVKNLVKKCEKQKALSCENYKLMLYTNELERCVMCLYRNKKILTTQLQKLNEQRIQEDLDTKEYLMSELGKKDETLRLEEQEKEKLVKEHEEIQKQINELLEKCEKNELVKNFFLNQRVTLERTLENLNEELKTLEDKHKKEVNDLLENMKEGSKIYEQEISNMTTNIAKLEKEKTELLNEKDKLSVTTTNLNSELEESNKEKHVAFVQMEHYIKVIQELEEVKVKKDEQLAECIKQKDEIYKESEEAITILKELKNKSNDLNQEKEAILVENSKLQECICNLQENVDEERKIINDLMKENKILVDRKKVLKDALQSRDSCKQELENHMRLLKDEMNILIKKLDKLRDDVTYCRNENLKIRQEIEQQLLCEMKLKNTPNDCEEETTCYSVQQLQEQIELGNQQNMKLEKTIEILEQSIMDKDKEIQDFDNMKKYFVDQYNQLLDNIKDIERTKEEQESHITFLEEELKCKSRKNCILKENCHKFEEYIRIKEEELKNCEGKTKRFREDNQKLLQKITYLECAISQEQMIGEKYRNDVQILANEKTCLDEKLVELRIAEEEKRQLQVENNRLEDCYTTLSLNYKGLHDCTETLLTIIKSQKERIMIQRDQMVNRPGSQFQTSHQCCCDQEETSGVWYTCDETDISITNHYQNRGNDYCSTETPRYPPQSNSLEIHDFENPICFNILSCEDSDDSM